jgi:transketolase
MDGVRKANSGHTGGPLSSSDFAYLLFSDFLTQDPDNPDWIDRDRFVLSIGHESMLLYTLLHLSGRLTIDDLKKFRQLHSKTPGHPEVDNPGVEATTGPLGQGVGMAVGMALAEVFLGKLFSNELFNPIDHFTYVLAGDGDLQEPVALGAAALAGHWRLSKLIMFYDSNQVQISGETSRSDSTDTAAVFEGLGWHVQIIDGHDHSTVRSAIQKAQVIDRPSIIIGNTIMAKGTASMEGSPGTHGSPLPHDEIASTKKGLGLPEETFFSPKEVQDHFQHRFTHLKTKVQEWNESLSSVQNNKDFAQLWTQVMEGNLPELDFPEFDDGVSLATRKAFGITLEKFAEHLPNILGGSADLEPSNCTGGFAKIVGDFQHNNPAGRNLTFGVREFPMSTILNGIALHGGIIPFGGTFHVFSDYSRPAIRLGALQKIRVIHEFTHDSFYVGEDGPTHQPIEQTMSLRTIPNLLVFRPADAKETAVCVKLALESKHTPSVLLLTRQGVPVFSEPAHQIEAGVRKGGYIIQDSERPEINLVATGSEVSLALEIAEKMKDRQIRVVSLPCWEIFDQQSETYRNDIIPNRGCLNVSIEAGITLGWQKYVGINGITIGLDHFGMSAPATELAKEFGFTAEQIIARIHDHLSTLL